MPTKKIHKKSVEETAPEPKEPETAVTVESVKFVTEIVEDPQTQKLNLAHQAQQSPTDNPPGQPKDEESPADEPSQETSAANQMPPDDGEIETKTVEIEPEKRKEMVEELFRPKETLIASEVSVHRNKSFPVWLWAALLLGVVLSIGAGLMLFAKGSLKLPVAVVKPTPTPTPSPTPVVMSLKREDLTVQVLNGGGVVGAASKMKELLEEKGYKVTAVANAKEYTHEETEILVKANKADYLTLLKEDLQGTYTLGTVAATLADDASTDVSVIVGKK